MAGRIPPEFIDQLLSRVDIVDIIDSRVHLKKAGKDYQALCPFHSEKTPSFTVSQDKQFYHCFGCGVHGSAIGFLMDYEHMSFPEVVEELAGRAGLEVPHGSRAAAAPDLEPGYRILEQADGFFRRQLRSHPQAGRAVAYLKERGLSGDIAAEFGLGYAPPGWNNLLRALGGDGRSQRQLVQQGLVVEQPEKRYDRFRDRIMFPIRDRRGRSIGFGGRVLGDDKPKYLNSPETPLFHKGRQLYGLFEARKALRRIDRLLIVEGYMDVIALAQFGIRYAVATLGTATTAEHLARLFRVSRELVFCFDGDQAGRDAAWKALKIALPLAREGREIRFLFLPQGEDPDTLVRQVGAEDFEQRVRTAQHLSDYFFEHLGAEVDMQSLDGRARLAEQAKPLLGQLPAGVYREMMTARLAQVVGLPPGRLGMGTAGRPRRPPGRRPGAAGRMTPVRWAIAILLQHPQLAIPAAAGSGDWRRLQAPGIGLLAELLDLTASHPNLTTAALIERWRESEHFVHLNKLAHYDLGGADQGLEQQLSGALERLNGQVRKQETALLYSRPRPSEMTEEERERLKALLQRPAENDSTGTKL
jgi:DNA primase